MLNLSNSADVLHPEQLMDVCNKLALASYKHWRNIGEDLGYSYDTCDEILLSICPDYHFPVWRELKVLCAWNAKPSHCKPCLIKVLEDLGCSHVAERLHNNRPISD